MNHQPIMQRIRSGEIEFLRYLWCDNSNVIRAKSLYMPSFMAYHADDSDEDLRAALEDAVSITAAMQSVPATRDAPAPEAGLAPVADMRLVPAWDSLVTAPMQDNVALVICEMFDGPEPWMHCPRRFLRRMIARLEAHDLTLHIGYELEFYLLRPAETPGALPVPVDQSPYARSLAAHLSHEPIAAMLRALWRQGIPVEQTYAEGGAGQYEITLEHCGPLALAGRLVHARDTIHAVAHDHGLIASFLPKLYEDGAGSGLHTHMSLWQNEQNSTADPAQPYALSPAANAFMAGILQHLPALMAVCTPSRNSFRRIRPHAWSGAYQAWGIANKEAALRVIKDPLTQTPNNVELKTVDAAANPYLALGCMIAAGVDGLDRDLRLPKPAEIDPGDYSAGEREGLGIEPLPATVEAALAHFAADEVLWGAMGAAMAGVFTAVRRAELESLKDLSFDAERRLLLQRY